MGLRTRLSLIASILFLAGMVAGSSFLILNARQRVSDEVESSVTLAYQLLSGLIRSTGRAELEKDPDALFEQLRTLQDARHIDITVQKPGAYSEQQAVENTRINAPGWFARGVMPPGSEYRIPVGSEGSEIVIRSNAADEVSEVWQETRTFLIVLLLVLLLLNSILYIIVGRWLKPVSVIVKGLEAMEKGDYSGTMQVASLPELNLIAGKLNRLNTVLKESREENNLLTSRALSIQEEERKRMARELHDELGQSISAVKAIAFSIVERIAQLDAKSAEGANKIGVISENVRDRIRNMMRRLRPAVLDELGLVPALEQMVDEWNDHHSDCFCSFIVSGDTDDIRDADICINLYRIVQESLTNVAHHAAADQVEISLACNEEEIRLGIRDNGRGFDPSAITPGMGLNNIRERVGALHGNMKLDSANGQGVMLDVTIPLNS